MGHVQESLDVAKKERVIFVSNHAITVEAVLINYFLYIRRAGLVGTLVFPEAFKLPFIREFFRSTQCVPVSIDHGTKTLKNRHVLVFPEGMDFINGIVNPQRVPRFHKGFLRIAKKYLEENHRKSVTVIPIGHVGIENMLKFWVLRNKTFLEIFVRPFVKYPFIVFPKSPFVFPSKVVINWGRPVRLKAQDLKNEQKMTFWANHFRSELLSLRRTGNKVRDMSLF
jgi:1-acyl-sn-glycerol-3-phosphate acyltransferase